MKMPAIVNGSAYELPDDPRRTSPAPRNDQRSFGWQSPTPEDIPMSVHMSSKPADEASRLPASAWLVLGIVLVAEVMDLLDSTITTIAAPTISSSLHGGPGLIKWLGASYALALGSFLLTRPPRRPSAPGATAVGA